MDRIDVPREEEINQQRQAEHEAERDDEPGLIGAVDDALGSVVRPFATENLDEEDAERQRRLNDAEQS